MIRIRNKPAAVRHSRAYAHDGSSHVERAMAMIFKAIGLRPHTWLFTATSRTTQWLLAVRRRRMARLATA